MAGVLPGVEAARIRRIHQSNGGSNSRRSSFCLYATNYQEFHITSSSPKIRRAGCDDEELQSEAREAKKRLDRKFQTHSKTANHNLKSKGKRKEKTDQADTKAIFNY